MLQVFEVHFYCTTPIWTCVCTVQCNTGSKLKHTMFFHMWTQISHSRVLACAPGHAAFSLDKDVYFTVGRWQRQEPLTCAVFCCDLRPAVISQLVFRSSALGLRLWHKEFPPPTVTPTLPLSHLWHTCVWRAATAKMSSPTYQHRGLRPAVGQSDVCRVAS